MSSAQDTFLFILDVWSHVFRRQFCVTPALNLVLIFPLPRCSHAVILYSNASWYTEPFVLIALLGMREELTGIDKNLVTIDDAYLESQVLAVSNPGFVGGNS